MRVLIIDRYIARQYLINVATLLLIFGSLFASVDTILNLGRFIDAGAELAGQRGTARHVVMTLVWMVNYWGPKLLQLFNFLAGMALVAAMGFTCAQLSRRRELVAAVAGGMSLHRLARPFLLVALGVTAAQAVNHEVFVPAVAPLLTRNPSDALRREVKPFQTPLVKDGSGRLWYASEYDPRARTLRDARVWERDESGRVTRRVSGALAKWDGAAWVFDNARVETGAGPARPERAAPETGETVRITTDLDPTGLVARTFADFGQNLSWRQIGRMFDGAPVDTRTRERFERVRWGRLSTMASNLLALVVALPFYLLREPRSMLGQTVKAAPLVIGALIAAVIGPAFALPGLPVWLGVFAPTLVLLPAAVAAAVSVKT